MFTRRVAAGHRLRRRRRSRRMTSLLLRREAGGALKTAAGAGAGAGRAALCGRERHSTASPALQLSPPSAGAPSGVSRHRAHLQRAKASCTPLSCTPVQSIRSAGAGTAAEASTRHGRPTGETCRSVDQHARSHRTARGCGSAPRQARQGLPPRALSATRRLDIDEIGRAHV